MCLFTMCFLLATNEGIVFSLLHFQSFFMQEDRHSSVQPITYANITGIHRLASIGCSIGSIKHRSIVLLRVAAISPIDNV